MKIEKLANSELSFEIIKEGEELKSIKKEVLSKFKNVKVDGFRKGHVPTDVIEKEFSEEIKEEFINKVLRAAYDEIISDETIKLASHLVVDEMIYEKEKFKLSARIALVPEFEVPKYKGLEIEKEEVTITDDEVNKELERMLNSTKKFEKSEKESVELGDMAIINFEGFVDGVAFEGGKSENYRLEIGSKSFIDTFEEQIIGHKVGEEFDVNVKFPDEYHSENLKGKNAIFKIKLNGIEIPVKAELNDDFAKQYGSENLEELKNTLKGRLLSAKEDKVSKERLAKIFDNLYENSNFEVSEISINDEINRQIDSFANQIKMQGGTLEQYLKLTNSSIEKMREDLKDSSKKSVKISYILSKITELENINISKEEFDTELNKISTMYGMTVDMLNSELDKSNSRREYYAQIETGLINKKINKFLLENN